MSEPTVRTPARCWVSATDDRATATVLPAELHYDADDPWAVGLLLGSVLWRFSRELLTDALGARSSTAGAGDVRLRRECDDLRIDLTSPQGHVAAWVRARTVRTFLQRTYSTVPAGGEVIDFDTEFYWLALTTGGDTR